MTRTRIMYIEDKSDAGIAAFARAARRVADRTGATRA
jgi:hypothetical protein